MHYVNGGSEMEKYNKYEQLSITFFINAVSNISGQRVKGELTITCDRLQSLYPASKQTNKQTNKRLFYLIVDKDCCAERHRN